MFNVLRGIWDAEKITDVDAVVIGALDLWMEQDVSLASLEAQVAPEQLTRAEPAEENHVVETEAHAVQWLHETTGFEELSLAAQLGYHERPIVPLEWQREAAIEVLGIEGES